MENRFVYLVIVIYAWRYIDGKIDSEHKIHFHSTSIIQSVEKLMEKFNLKQLNGIPNERGNQIVIFMSNIDSNQVLGSFGRSLLPEEIPQNVQIQVSTL